MLGIVAPHGALLAEFGLWKAKLALGALRAPSQHALNELSEGPEYMLEPRYAQVLTSLFVTMFYSAGLPVLYFFAAATFAVFYWVEKITLMRFYRKVRDHLCRFCVRTSH